MAEPVTTSIAIAAVASAATSVVGKIFSGQRVSGIGMAIAPGLGVVANIFSAGKRRKALRKQASELRKYSKDLKLQAENYKLQAEEFDEKQFDTAIALEDSVLNMKAQLTDQLFQESSQYATNTVANFASGSTGRGLVTASNVASILAARSQGQYEDLLRAETISYDNQRKSLAQAAEADEKAASLDRQASKVGGFKDIFGF